jgi:hypothetical protein
MSVYYINEDKGIASYKTGNNGVRNRHNGGFRSGSFADIRRKGSGEQPVWFWYLPVINKILVYVWGSRT